MAEQEVLPLLECQEDYILACVLGCARGTMMFMSQAHKDGADILEAPAALTQNDPSTP